MSFKVEVEEIRISLWTKIDCCRAASVYASKRMLGRINGFLHTKAIHATMDILPGLEGSLDTINDCGWSAEVNQRLLWVTVINWQTLLHYQACVELGELSEGLPGWGKILVEEGPNQM